MESLDLSIPYSEIINIRNDGVTSYKARENPHAHLMKKETVPEVSYDSSYESDSEIIEPRPYDGKKNIDFVLAMVESEASRREQFSVTHPNSIVKGEEDEVFGVKFCHYRFQKCLQIRWAKVKLKRLLKLLLGENVNFPKKLLNYEAQFEKIYGPIDRKNESYLDYFDSFMVERMRLVLQMVELEGELINDMMGYDFTPKIGEKWINQLLELQSKLEDELNSIPEANINLNPFTSPLRMDFMIVPRPKLSITSYVVRPLEMDNFVEYQSKEVPAEGYNPAVMDVGLTYPDKIVCGFKWISLKDEDAKAEKRKKDFKQAKDILDSTSVKQHGYVTKISQMLMKYPLGIEAKRFFKQFKDQEGLFENENIFGKYGDVSGGKIMADVIYYQKLGREENQRVILFHSRFKGLICTPEDILRRIWKRIRFLMDINKGSAVDLELLLKKYEKNFNQKIYPSDWGFDNMNHFVEYSIKVLPDELKDFELMDEEQFEKFSKGEQWNPHKENKAIILEAKDLFEGTLYFVPWK